MGDGITGLELIKKINALNPNIKTFISTNTPKSLIENDLLNSSATGYLNIPLDLDDLKKALS